MGHHQAPWAPVSPSCLHILVTSTFILLETWKTSPCLMTRNGSGHLPHPYPALRTSVPSVVCTVPPLNSSCTLVPRMASSVDVLVSICVVFAMSFVPASFTLELSLGRGAGTAWRGGGPATTCHCPFWPFLGRDLSRMAQVKSWGLWETSCPATQSTGRRSEWGTVPRVPVPTPAH